MLAGPVPLVDPFDRRVKDLRISITDRCNFRCTYCMPAEGMKWLPREELLTYEEQARIARVCVERFGFEALRITGGEPTLRAHLPRLIAMLAPLDVDLALTSNGVKLPEMAHDLAAAGLRRINVSLDSLRPDTFAALTRRNDTEPATRYRYLDGAGDVGVIPSVTEPFCDHCDRVRVTAEGKFRTCLFALEEFDLREIMRDSTGAHDEHDEHHNVQIDDRLASE